MAYKYHVDNVAARKTATGKAFAIVLGQMFPTMIDQTELSMEWEAISEGTNLITLL